MIGWQFTDTTPNTFGWVGASEAGAIVVPKNSAQNSSKSSITCVPATMRREPASVAAAQSSLPVQRVIARALPLPKIHMVQVLNIAHNPVLSDVGFIDE